MKKGKTQTEMKLNKLMKMKIYIYGLILFHLKLIVSEEVVWNMSQQPCI